MQTHLGPVGSVVDRLSRGFCQTARSLKHVRPSMALWTSVWGLSALNWVLDAICLALAFKAVGSRVPWGAVLLVFAGSKVVTSIGSTPGGLGIVEGGLVATFVAYGLPGADAGAAVLVYRALTLIGLVGIGWLFVALLAFEDRRAPERSPATPPHRRTGASPPPQAPISVGRLVHERRAVSLACYGWPPPIFKPGAWSQPTSARIRRTYGATPSRTRYRPAGMRLASSVSSRSPATSMNSSAVRSRCTSPLVSTTPARAAASEERLERSTSPCRRSPGGERRRVIRSPWS